MEELKAKPGMPTRMVIGIAVLVAVVFGGGTYAYVNNKAAKEKNDLNAQITELQKQVATVGTTATTTAPSTTTTTDETASWKTYTNEKYFYSIKYPATGWSPYNNDEEAADSQRVAYRLANYQFKYDPGYSKKSGEAVIFISTSSTSQSLAQIVSAYTTKTKKTINGVDFYFVDRTNVSSDEGGTINDLVYITVKDGVEYTIQLTPASPGESIVDTFNQVASTFQFTK